MSTASRIIPSARQLERRREKILFPLWWDDEPSAEIMWTWTCPACGTWLMKPYHPLLMPEIRAEARCLGDRKVHRNYLALLDLMTVQNESPYPWNKRHSLGSRGMPLSGACS